MKTTRSKIGVACGAAALALALVGCGGGGATLEARQLSGISILEKTKPLDQNLVKQSDIAKTPNASGLKTLLQFWLTLQYQDYELATNFFYPELANFVGVAQLALALRNESGLWSSTKPDVVEATTTGNTARVVFVIHNLLGNVTPVTVSFRKLGAAWKINYLTLLDEALRAWAQQRTQILSAPSSSKSVKQGLAAGIQAFQLQSRYLEKERSESARSGAGGADKANAGKAGNVGAGKTP
jgi:hypothetical protein